eukprot:TRINITY_DN12100_c0_g1_i2.p1 TRINITY_DN12100_c0_g1~~TRINITY_DN12100_c0_g1_i2.p1  ORF type:complete len:198 (+),score=17.97 TRINITY_DN12100_c0_g1_i2:181-774(+)
MNFPACICCLGLLTLVSKDGGAQGRQEKFGSAGIPCPCLMGGVSQVICCGGTAMILEGCVCLRFPQSTRGAMNMCSLLFFCCTKCRTLPNLITVDEGEVGKPNAHAYIVDAKLCQPGVVFGGLFPGQSCRTIEWEIREITTGVVSGKIVRKDESSNLLYWCQVANTFTIDFPIDASPELRTILFASVISLYTTYFDV